MSSDDNFHRKISDDILKSVENSIVEESGWEIEGVSNVVIQHYKQSRNVKTYGCFVQWPTKAAGKHTILNIDTKSNCVEYSMIAHFGLKDGSLSKSIIKNRGKYLVNFCENKRSHYFTFPLCGNVAIEDFSRNE